MSLRVGNFPINTFACCLYYIILYYMASVYSSTRYSSINILTVPVPARHRGRVCVMIEASYVAVLYAGKLLIRMGHRAQV